MVFLRHLIFPQHHVIHAQDDQHVRLGDLNEQEFFVLYEQYDDEAAVQAHCDSPHFVATVAGQIFPLLSDRRLEIYASA